MTVDGVNPPHNPRYKSGKPKPENLDDERTLLLYLGLAVTSWQHVEEELCSVLIHVRGEDTRNATLAEYRSLDGAKLRLDMVNDEIRKLISEDTALAEWKKLYNRVNRQRQIRNKLVHFKVVFDATDLHNQQYCVVPNITSTIITNNPYPKHNWLDLFEFSQKFLRLSRELSAFCSRLSSA
jgi:hypothetical protein